MKHLIHLFKLKYKSGYTRYGLTLNEAVRIQKGRRSVKMYCDKIVTLIASLLLLIGLSSAKSEVLCDDCGMRGCIYQAIDRRYNESKDSDILESVYWVCAERGITDKETIELIKANYNL